MTTPSLPEELEHAYPLSPVQLGMLYDHIRSPESGSYITKLTVDLEGPVDRERLKAAWTAAVQKYRALRTIFIWDGLDEPLQVVMKEIDLPWVDQESDTDFDGEFELSEIAYRIRLVNTSATSWRLEWLCHHIVLDGWSARIVVNEVLSRYRDGLFDPDAEPYPVSNFVTWLRTQDGPSQRAFWTRYLADIDGPCLLTTSVHKPPTTGGFERFRRIDRSLPDLDIESATKNLKVTLNTLISGAWAVVLGRYLGRSNVLFGFTSSGRPAVIDGSDTMVGMFMATQPASVNLDWRQPAAAFLADLQLNLAEIRRHEHVPLSVVQKTGGGSAGRPLFDSLVVVENIPSGVQDAAFGDIEVSAMRIEEHSEYPMALLVHPGPSVELHLIYDSSKFDDEFARRVLDHFCIVLKAMLDDGNRQIGGLPMLTDSEESALVTRWSAGETHHVTGNSLLEVIQRNVEEQPEAIAARSAGITLTYAALGSWSDRLASELMEAGVSKGDRVGIFLERSAFIPMALLGVMKSGGVFVLLDPGYPPRRIKLMLDSVGARVVVTEAKLAASLGETIPVVLVPDPAHEEASGFETSPDSGRIPLLTVTRDDLAYVMFTSGSTGRPKGVAVSHGNLLNSTEARRNYYSGGVERFLLLSSAAFDSSLVGFFWTLASGGTLVIPDDRAEQDLSRLADLIRKERITHTLMIPTLYSLLLDVGSADDLSTLTTVIVAGEACHPGLVAKHYSTIPGTELHNEYGPTEATVWCLAHRTSREDVDAVPIGRPVANTRAYVVAPDLSPLPAGIAGELLIAGQNVAAGYWQNPEATKERFVPEPLQPSGGLAYRTGDLARFRSDGLVEFLGRTDSQLKIRGYRVETAEIERVLMEHPATDEVVVVPAYRSVPHDRIVSMLESMDPAESERLLAEIEQLQEP